MLSKALKVAQFQLKQNILSLHILLLFSLIVVFILATITPVNDFASAYNIGITPWAFPLLVNDYVCQLVIMSGAVLLFCNAPFGSEIYNYLLPRSGNAALSAGTCLYIAAIAFLYILVILISGVVAVLPNLELAANWGKAWGSLTDGQFSYHFSIPLSVNKYVVGAYTPGFATALSFVLEWACCTWLGLITYWINNATDAIGGSLTAIGFVLLDVTIANEWSYSFYKISPTTMAQISALANAHSIYGLTVSYAFLFYSLTGFCFTVLCIFVQCRKNSIVEKRGR